MNAKEFEKKYNLSLNQLRPAITSFAPHEESLLNNIAGKPKKLLVEIFKRFFTSWSSVLALIVFIAILVISIVVTASAKYSATEPLSTTIPIYLPGGAKLDTSTPTVQNLPPIFSPWYSADNINDFDKTLNTWADKQYYHGLLWSRFMYFGPDNPNNAIKIIDLADGIQTTQVNAYVFNKVSNIAIALNKIFDGKANVATVEQVNAQIDKIIALNPQFNLSTYLGTNREGIDIWTLSWVGTWQAIRLAIIVATIQTIIGVAIGAYLGFHVGSWIDTVIMRLIDIFVAPPTLIWLLIFASTFGTTDLTLGIALVFIGWVGSVGSTRMFIITVKDQEYITASKSVGASKSRLIYKHALPAIIGKISTSYVASIPSIIMSVSSLAFLGFFKSDQANLGAILSSAASQAGDNAFILVLPALILLLISVSLHFVALGVHDALDPKVIKTR
ncbi:ABC transporter permease [Mycoplasmopsis verecunda]|uniref:Oligopeptide transport system permease protein n=1 Tax=Mycoplasmopsis verecunda TaxID=171291 RepID=A0A1T4L7Q2_9BACT|nr:ABC transporter permease [Mycoplasmopsis verecunda]WPB54771.1 ABC transporter permease [Mycoplasmopsis verecunda]SJZ50541.1 oligopeptide transport system permease protein [Mycoplasmopsis verecunda]